jgi:enoyl-CoA hydratase
MERASLAGETSKRGTSHYGRDGRMGTLSGRRRDTDLEVVDVTAAEPSTPGDPGHPAGAGTGTGTDPGAATSAGPVRVRRDGPVTIVTLDRPEVRNAVDGPTAAALDEAFLAFEADGSAHVAVLSGAGGTFCAGADLHAVTDPDRVNRLERSERAPMGPTRRVRTKPVIAAIEGHAVAGGLELALWCDLRVVSATAVLGVFCRRWGVPLIDGGTVRLPRLIGLAPALDLILTGRAVAADEAQRLGLASRLVPAGQAEEAAVALAHELARLPQLTLRADLRSAHASFDRPLAEALLHEHDLGVAAIEAGGMSEGVARFQAGAGRHGQAAPGTDGG